MTIAPMASPSRIEVSVRAVMRAAERQSSTADSAIAKPLRICHFTTAHSEIKSRSLHREFLPLAAAGFEIRYVSPARIRGVREGVEFVPIAKLSRRWQRVMAAPSLLLTLLRQQADIYHFQDPELLPVALTLKAIFRRRVIYDAYEDFPSMALQSSLAAPPLRRWLSRIVAAAESVAAQILDGVMTADPLTMRRMARTGSSRKLVFYNFPNLEFFPAPQSGAKKYDIVYRGGISERAGTYVLLDAMHQMARGRRAPRLLLIGYFDSPAEEDRLRVEIATRGLDEYVELRGRMPHEEMAAALREARIGVSPLQATEKFMLNIPVKLFEYWACGLPVIASDLPSIHPFMRNTNASILFPPGDASALACALSWMLDHPREAARMGQTGRAAVVERFNNYRESARFRDFLLRIARRP